MKDVGKILKLHFLCELWRFETVECVYIYCFTESVRQHSSVLFSFLIGCWCISHHAKLFLQSQLTDWKMRVFVTSFENTFPEIYVTDVGM